jgi:hypothetical protein
MSRPGICFIPFAFREFGALGGHTTGFLESLPCKKTPPRGCMWASCRSPDAERFLSPSMSLMRTMPCAGCLPPRTVLMPLLPRLGYLLMPRRSSPAPGAACTSVLPRTAREAPLVAFTCYAFNVAWECLVFSCVSCPRYVHDVVAFLCRAFDYVTLLSLYLPSWFYLVFLVHLLSNHYYFTVSFLFLYW